VIYSLRGNLRFSWVLRMKTSKRYKCPICSFTCGRKNDFNTHVVDFHNFLSTQDAYNKVILKTSKNLTCACGCEEELKFESWNVGYSSKFKLGHNGSIYSIYDEKRAKEISNKRSLSLKGKEGWSKGLTKETDDRILRRSKKIKSTLQAKSKRGEIASWSKGLTKETDDRLLKLSKKLSDKYRSGELIPWAKGLTKETDNRVLEMSLNVAETLNNKKIRDVLDSKKRLSEDEVIKRLNINAPKLKLISKIDSYKRDKIKNLIFECRNCHKQQTKSLIQAMSNRCEDCDPHGSKHQIEINDFIRSLGKETIMCDRSTIRPYEIDILVKECRLGIEYNGLYFHSEEFKDKNYHKRKSELSLEQNIKLIHVFEDEWEEKRSIVKSMIRHRLGMTKIKIPARKCKIIDVAYSDRKKFFNENHIDGDTKSSWALGLVYNKEIVACISVRKPFHKKYKGYIEIARFANKIDVVIQGGLSKLIKHVKARAKKDRYQKIMTYVDLRHGLGESYLKSGFLIRQKTINRFWWTDGKTRINRFKIKADPTRNMSEKEVSEEVGVVKIWGCPNIILEVDI